MHIKKISVLVLTLLMPLLAMADGYYSNNTDNFMSKPFNTLELGVRTSYPPNINTVGQAIMYVLATTDYKVGIGYPYSTSAAAIAVRPIPPEAIQDKVMPIYQALLLLIGNDSRLVVDTKHKLLTFETIPGKG